MQIWDVDSSSFELNYPGLAGGQRNKDICIDVFEVLVSLNIEYRLSFG